MSTWKQVLSVFASDVEKYFDRLKYRLHYMLGGPREIIIVPYRGYGTPQRLYLKGRVLEDKRIRSAQEDDNIWDNMVNMFKRMESDEIPHARLEVRFEDQVQTITADEEGYFEVWIEPQKPISSNQLWHEAEITLLEPLPRNFKNDICATGEILVPPATAKYVVISDIDDTIIQTDAAHLLRMARNVFLSNSRSRLPFPGVAALYRALLAGASGHDMNPLFYVSSSPWNLYDLLVDFFHLQDIPIGPVLFLRDWGVTEEEILPTDNFVHKLKTIRKMIDAYPDLPFILVGDSAQQDPEIYAQLAREYPKRIQAIYIRNVARDLKRPEAIRELIKEVVATGSTMVLADDTYTIAQNALEQKWIRKQALADIRQEKKKDEAPATPLEKMLQQDEKTPGPTVTFQVPQTGQAAEQENRAESVERTLEEEGKSEHSKTPNVVIKSGSDIKSQEVKVEPKDESGENRAESE